MAIQFNINKIKQHPLKNKVPALLIKLLNIKAKTLFLMDLTRQLKKRIRSEARYSILSTNTMRLAKKYGLNKQAQRLADVQKISKQKSYYFSLLKMTLIYSHLVSDLKHSEEEARKAIFGYLNDKLLSTAEGKYAKTNSKLFIQLVIQKNTNDLVIFEKLFRTRNELEADSILKNLYNTYGLEQHEKQRKTLRQIYLKYLNGVQNIEIDKTEKDENQGKQESQMTKSKQEGNLQISDQHLDINQPLSFYSNRVILPLTLYPKCQVKVEQDPSQLIFKQKPNMRISSYS